MQTNEEKIQSNKAIVLLQQGVAKHVLDTLKAKGYHAFVAGGAARDWYSEEPARDIDIIVVEPSSTIDTMTKLAEEHWPSFKALQKSTSGQTYLEMINGILGVLEFKVDKHTVQLVVIDAECYSGIPIGSKWYDKFPASNTKISWCDGVFDTSEEFLFSIKHKIIMFDNNKNNKTAATYLNKIKKRFPDYKIFVNKRAPNASLTLKG